MHFFFISMCVLVGAMKVRDYFAWRRVLYYTCSISKRWCDRIFFAIAAALLGIVGKFRFFFYCNIYLLDFFFSFEKYMILKSSLKFFIFDGHNINWMSYLSFAQLLWIIKPSKSYFTKMFINILKFKKYF